MRHVEDQGDARATGARSRSSLVTILVAVAVGGAYAVGAGLQNGNRLLSVLLAAAAVFHLGWAGRSLVQPHRALAPVGVVVAFVFFVAAGVPALRSDHQHGSGSEVAAGEDSAGPGSGAGGGVGSDGNDAGGDDNGAGHTHHGAGHASDAPVISLYDPRLTDEQRRAARLLIEETTRGMAAYPDVDSVVAAGYVSIGDSSTGFEHFIHLDYITDGIELDPDRIESVVARVNPDGSKDIVSAMYLMAPESTMDDVPDIAGPLTQWHDHQDLCWEGIRVVGRVGPGGDCERGEFRGTAPMMHVWLVPHPCGPFAGLEGHGGGCAHQH